jgi:hypothetical protein
MFFFFFFPCLILCHSLTNCSARYSFLHNNKITGGLPATISQLVRLELL